MTPFLLTCLHCFKIYDIMTMTIFWRGRHYWPDKSSGPCWSSQCRILRPRSSSVWTLDDTGSGSGSGSGYHWDKHSDYYQPGLELTPTRGGTGEVINQTSCLSLAELMAKYLTRRVPDNDRRGPTIIGVSFQAKNFVSEGIIVLLHNCIIKL